ncbi:unnamed protein product [Nesidiocoris tenuis]|uniref:Uncharacterized protein n=1 Tax=Nesidiocoris tenuis TaxID=355587 RepID=A0A6H5G7T1_9HEMI|nr:unnamed protein product [Nesidiocoris tenuis]
MESGWPRWLRSTKVGTFSVTHRAKMSLFKPKSGASASCSLCYIAEQFGEPAKLAVTIIRVDWIPNTICTRCLEQTFLNRVLL